MEWQKLYSALWVHPKAIGLPLDAIGLWTKCLCWVGQNESNGLIPGSVVMALGRETDWEALADELVAVGLWRATDDGYEFHDYDHWQAGSIALREARREAGKKGGLASAQSRQKRHGTSQPSKQPEANSKQNRSKLEADRDIDIDIDLTVTNVTVLSGSKNQTAQVFEAWLETLGPDTKRLLTEARRKKIAARLKTFPVAEVIEAVRGWVNDPWDGRIHQNDITILLRSDEQCEKFRDLHRLGAPLSQWAINAKGARGNEN